MELHIQKCQNCNGRDMRNILARGEEQHVFVQCRACDQLVARYILRSGGYFHAGKEFESFLRSMERDLGSPSAKDLQDLFEEVKKSTQEQFEEIQRELKRRYRDGIP